MNLVDCYDKADSIIKFVLFVVCNSDDSECDGEQVLEFDGWSNPVFVVYFMVSCGMGFLLMYSIIVCTNHNSALTTTIVGVLKVPYAIYECA